MQKLDNPLPLFLDRSGQPLYSGRIWIGEAGQDPKTNPIDLFFDQDGNTPADQPLRTLGGVIVNEGTPAFIFFEEEDFSITVEEHTGAQVFAFSSMAEAGGAPATLYQPLDSDLTAIAALATTTFGRSLLTLANAAALKAAAGITDSLPLTGGTVTGAILRSGAGAHLYHATAGLASGRVYLTASGASDPTSAAGDIWLTYTP